MSSFFIGRWRSALLIYSLSLLFHDMATKETIQVNSSPPSATYMHGGGSGKCYRGGNSKKKKRSLFVSVLVDKSTDISVLKKIVLVVQITNDNMVPETCFFGNADVEDGAGKTIAAKVLDVLKKTWNRHLICGRLGDRWGIRNDGKKDRCCSLLEKRESAFIVLPIVSHCVHHKQQIV